MGDYSVAEAKAHLSSLLEQVARGEEVTLTKRGKPVARIVPAEQLPVKPKINLVALRKFRANMPMSPITATKMIRKMRDEEQGW